MSRTHNTIGSLATLKSHLEENNIFDFKSLKEVIDFQSSFAISRQQLISLHKNLIEEEKNLLNVELKDLGTAIDTKRQQTGQILTDEIEKLKQQLSISISHTPTNLFQKITKILRLWNYKRKIKHKENKFESDVKTEINHLVDNYQKKSNRYQFITSNVDEAVKQSVHHSLSELERKKAVIDSLNSFIYGALGEQRVVKTLENLSDEYTLINDFSESFSPSIAINEGDREKTLITKPTFVVLEHIEFADRGNYKTSSGKFKGLTVHSTISGRTANNAMGVVAYLKREGYGCMVMDENGIIYIPKNFDIFKNWGYHSGISKWKEINQVSDHFAGMEICCWGKDSTVGPYREVKVSEGYIVSGKYQKFTKAQEKSLINFILWAKSKNSEFEIDCVVGHDELRKEAGRLGDKQDPGGSLSMPMTAFRDLIKSKLLEIGIA